MKHLWLKLLWLFCWPNDRPTLKEAAGYCIDCDCMYSSEDWKPVWCSSCKKHHTSCPHCDVPLEFRCMTCGQFLLKTDKFCECAQCRTLRPAEQAATW